MFSPLYYFICIAVTFVSMYTYYFFKVEKPTDTFQSKVVCTVSIFLVSLLWYISVPVTLIVLLIRELLGLFNKPKVVKVVSQVHSPAITEAIEKYAHTLDESNKLALQVTTMAEKAPVVGSEIQHMLSVAHADMNELPHIEDKVEQVINTVETVVKELPEVESEVMTVPRVSNLVKEVVAEIPKETPALLEIEAAVQANLIPEVVKTISLVGDVVPEAKVIIPAVGVLPVDVAKRV